MFLKGNWSSILFVTHYVPIALFPILYIAAKLIGRVPTVKVGKMDFVADVAEFDAMRCVPLYCRERHVRVTKLTRQTGSMVPNPGTVWRRSGCGWYVPQCVFVSCTSSPCRLPRCDPYTARRRCRASHTHPIPPSSPLIHTARTCSAIIES